MLPKGKICTNKTNCIDLSNDIDSRKIYKLNYQTIAQSVGAKVETINHFLNSFVEQFVKEAEKFNVVANFRFGHIVLGPTQNLEFKPLSDGSLKREP